MTTTTFGAANGGYDDDSKWSNNHPTQTVDAVANGSSGDIDASGVGSIAFKSFDFTGYTGDFRTTNAPNWNPYGDLTFSAGMTFSGLLYWDCLFKDTGTLTMNGPHAITNDAGSPKPYDSASSPFYEIQFRGDTGTLTLGDTCYVIGGISAQGDTSGTIALGTHQVHVVGGDGYFYIQTGNQFTWSAGGGFTIDSSAIDGPCGLSADDGTEFPPIVANAAGIYVDGDAQTINAYTQNAGDFDNGGYNTTFTANLALNGGTASNLGGGSLTVGGNFTAAVDLIGASSWTLDVTGTVTIYAGKTLTNCQSTNPFTVTDVLDGGGNSGNITFLTSNTPPTADAGDDDTTAAPTPYSYNLQGSVSDVDEGDTVTALWTKTSGPGTVTFDDNTDPTTRAVFSAKGAYVLRLTADDGTDTAFDETTITVENTAPDVYAGDDRNFTLPGVFTLEGTATDADDDTTTVLWTQLDGPDDVTFLDDSNLHGGVTFPVNGTYVLQLSVDDGDGPVLDSVRIIVSAQVNTFIFTLPNEANGIKSVVVKGQTQAQAIDALTTQYSFPRETWENAVIQNSADVAADLTDIVLVVQVRKTEFVTTEFRYTASDEDSWDNIITEMAALMAADGDLSRTTNDGDGVLKLDAADNMGDKVILSWVEINDTVIAYLNPEISDTGVEASERTITFDTTKIKPYVAATIHI